VNVERIARAEQQLLREFCRSIDQLQYQIWNPPGTEVIALLEKTVNMGSPTEDLVGLLNFDREERARIVDRTPPGSEWIFTPVIWDYRPRTPGTLVYTTFVRVFEDETLSHNECSLNLPERVSSRLPKKAARLRFQYRSSTVAGFEIRIEDI